MKNAVGGESPAVAARLLRMALPPADRLLGGVRVRRSALARCKPDIAFELGPCWLTMRERPWGRSTPSAGILKPAH